MIEEIKLLIPLLQSAGESAFWLIIIYFIYNFVKMSFVLVILLYFIYKVHSLIMRCNEPTIQNILYYNYDFNKINSNEISYLLNNLLCKYNTYNCNISELKEKLKSIS